MIYIDDVLLLISVKEVRAAEPPATMTNMMMNTDMMTNTTQSAKPLNRYELQEIFDRFAGLPYENKIALMGYYEKRYDEPVERSKMRYNPNFRYVHVRDEAGEVLKTINTAKTILRVPSLTRTRADGTPYVASIPLFTTDAGVDTMKYINTATREKKQYVYCTGAIQNCFIVRKAQPSPAIYPLLAEWMAQHRGGYNEALAAKILKILRLSLDYEDGVKLPMLNVWLRDIFDANEEARDLYDHSQPIGINRASITGLVYMPPSYRRGTDSTADRLHFKVRVKREDSEGANIPDAQQAVDGYDIINVIYLGERAREYYESLRQGYPVRVRGSLENYNFCQRTTVNSIEQHELARLLGVDVCSTAVQDIVSLVRRANLSETIPSYNVVAQDIATDYENW